MDLPRKTLAPGRAGGFTLSELLITLGITGVLVTGVVPTMQRMVSNARMTTRVNAIVTSLAQARAKSIYSGHHVVLCPSTDGEQCRKEVRWDRGWIVFLDRNANRVRDGNEQLLRYEQAKAGGEILTSKARTRITFRSTGTRLNPGSSAGSNATFTFCDPRGPAHAVAVSLSNTGRPRLIKPAPAAKAALCSD